MFKWCLTIFLLGAPVKCSCAPLILFVHVRPLGIPNNFSYTTALTALTQLNYFNVCPLISPTFYSIIAGTVAKFSARSVLLESL